MCERHVHTLSEIPFAEDKRFTIIVTATKDRDILNYTSYPPYVTKILRIVREEEN